MYNPITQHVQVLCDVVWLHHMFYQKAKNTEELNMDPITVCNWTRNSQGVHRGWERVSEVPVVENAEITEDHENSLIENKLEDQPINNQEAQIDNPNVTEALSQHLVGSVDLQFG